MYFKNDVGTVYYEVYGPENAPAVLFSHGVAMDHRTFESQIRALEERYRVIVWDMPYHGYSSPIDRNTSKKSVRRNKTSRTIFVSINILIVLPFCLFWRLQACNRRFQ